MTLRIPTDWPPLVGDQPALDLLNTVVQENGNAVDYLDSDEAAAQWLSRVTGRAQQPHPSLAQHARDLRETLRGVVEARKQGAPAALERLNELLAHFASHPQLEWQGDKPAARRVYEDAPAWRALAPLGEAAVELLAQGDFSLVRQCEHEECTLWFYDRTKSHRRRWCSMAFCGNRHKVSEFRKRRST